MNPIHHHAMAVLLGLVLCGALGCSRSPETDGEIKDSGRIRVLDIPNRTLMIRHRLPSENPNENPQMNRTYKVAYDCRISTVDKPDAELSDLKKDEEVSIRYLKDGQDFIIYRIKPD